MHRGIGETIRKNIPGRLMIKSKWDHKIWNGSGRSVETIQAFETIGLNIGLNSSSFSWVSSYSFWGCPNPSWDSQSRLPLIHLVNINFHIILVTLHIKLFVNVIVFTYLNNFSMIEKWIADYDNCMCNFFHNLCQFSYDWNCI